MAIVNAAQAEIKTVGDPNASYESLKPLWTRSKAVCSGERFVKDLDGIVSTRNMLIPFSASMTQTQYDFFKAEAELPGITAQFSKMLIGGLLRKTPVLTLPESVPEDAHDWIINQFGQDDSQLVSVLDTALWEEIRSSRCWIFVDYPSIDNVKVLSKEQRDALKPYPIIMEAESVINWRYSSDDMGKDLLSMVIVKGLREDFEKNEFHPTYIETVDVHDLDEAGLYRIRKYEKEAPSQNLPVVAGKKLQRNEKGVFILKETIETVQMNGQRLAFIPAWPLNGSVEPVEPILSTIIDKEISLYNKISRRNHLLYGAATYTPIISSDMEKESFDEITEAGLGSWILLEKGDTASVLATPTAALQDMDRAIAASIEEIAKLGIRMLTPETDQSGVALQLRNAAQTAQLGTLNSKISGTLKQIIAFMIEWRYDIDMDPKDVDFSLSADFNPTPLGPDWLRLATEWYEGGKIPRSIWLTILKHNDILSPDYDDNDGQKEINEDTLLNVNETDYMRKTQLKE